jgi:hypothetical protein
MRRIISFVNRALHRKGHLSVDELAKLAEEIVGHGCMVSLFVLPDPATPARTVGVDVDDLAFRLRETKDSVTAALALLEKEGRANRTWLDGHWILLLKPRNMRSQASERHKDQRSA